MGFAHGSKSEGSLRRNPFYLLGAAATDNPARIAALADERSLTAGLELCRKAQADLVNSHARFSAEIAWLPGVSPHRAVEEAENIGCESPDAPSELPPLARANALAARMESGQITDEDIVPALLALAAASEAIDPEVVLRDINQDRSIANIPPADDTQLLHSELAARQEYYRHVARQLLNDLPTRTLVRLISELAAKSTDGARKRASTLVEELVDGYESDAQAFIDGESYNLKKLAALVRLRARGGEIEISGLIALLRRTLANWSHVVAPILLINGGKGSDHPASRRLAFQVRSLAAELDSEYGCSRSANELLDCLRLEFALLSDFRDRAPKAAPAIAEVPREKVAEVPREKVAEVPREKVAEVPREKVAEVPREKVAEVPREKVAEVPKEKVAEVPKEKVAEVPREKVAEVPREKVAEVPKEKDRPPAANRQEFDRSLFYSAEVGLIFKRRLEISAAGLSWKGRIYRLEEINSLRWGPAKPALSGLPIGATYVIRVQTPNLGAVISLRSADDYGAIIGRLWRTVGVRILFEYIEQLKHGARLAFPSVLVEDVAVTLTDKRETRLTWDKVCARSSDHYFMIGMKGDSDVCTAMSYTKTNNVRVLEHMIGLTLASGKPAISAILDSGY